MLMNAFEGILIPFVGTTLGAACVFFMRKTLSKLLQRALAGFAAGIMVAASIWSLLIPAIKQSENMGTLSFVPAVFRDIEACSYTIPESNGYASMAALSSCYGGTDCGCVL